MRKNLIPSNIYILHWIETDQLQLQLYPNAQNNKTKKDILEYNSLFVQNASINASFEFSCEFVISASQHLQHIRADVNVIHDDAITYFIYVCHISYLHLHFS